MQRQEALKMEKIIAQIVHNCLKKDLLTEEDAPWLQYALEKRISTTLTSIPFILLSIYLTAPIIGLSMILTFFYLRTYTSGYHANSILGCFVLSILYELVFTTLFIPLLTNISALIISTLSCVILLKFAPYRHPKMSLSDSEYLACSNQSRKRVLVILGISLVCYVLSVESILIGCTTGMTMATILLLCAYIIDERRKHNEKNTQPH